MFGQIAAANALSDVYAMGGKPAVAMNLLCVPNCLSKETIRLILKGGHDKAVEAGCTIAGGHTIQDPEPKYGLCVTGYVNPKKILKNVGAEPGDLLVLTKPIGTGVLTTAAKADFVSPEDYNAMVACMAALNAKAAEIVQTFDHVHACTDITGFGLLGHAYEMAQGSDSTLKLFSTKIPLLNGAKDLASMGFIPSGAYLNMEYVRPHLEILDTTEESLVDLISDPQTSGGLLISLPEVEALELVRQLKA
ncbi:MAG: selenide, water dikinase SelD, partial [Lachnospiraceae bacterium]|nr:selenide, water dikinase SelD [Lachnospiraceae bacterium]